MSSWISRFVFFTMLVSALWLLWDAPAALMSQTATTSRDSKGLQTQSTMLPSGVQQIVVVDEAAQAMAVYHIEPLYGKIQLKSVRKLSWDLQMEQFNGEAPLPSELRTVQP